MVGAMFSRGSRQKVARPPLTDEQLLAAAVSALASRSRSEAELRRLLQKKLTEPGGPRIDKVVARLHELGYLSDARLAEQFVEIRQKQAHLGRRRVSQELLRRGVKADLVGDTVERAYAEVDEVAARRDRLRRLRRRRGDVVHPRLPGQRRRLRRTYLHDRRRSLTFARAQIDPPLRTAPSTGPAIEPFFARFSVWCFGEHRYKMAHSWHRLGEVADGNILLETLAPPGYSKWRNYEPRH